MSRGGPGRSFRSDHALRKREHEVQEELALLDVGVAMAMNDTKQVEAWIQAGKLGKPTVEDLARWPLEANQRFSSIVEQPYVLITRPKAAVLS